MHPLLSVGIGTWWACLDVAGQKAVNYLADEPDMPNLSSFEGLSAIVTGKNFVHYYSSETILYVYTRYISDT